MIEYKNALEDVLTFGTDIPPARENMPNTRMLNSLQSAFTFENGFPILTAKTMPFYSIVGELVGFMKGVTDVREFDKLGTKVWWDNAYKWNIVDNPKMSSISIDEYKNEITTEGWVISNNYYSLGRIYSVQWRDWFGITRHKNYGYINNRVDQLDNLITSIKTNPYSRYHNMTTWNPSEMNVDTVSQPNCHVYFQASCAPIDINTKAIAKYLRLFLTERTVEYLFSKGYAPTNKLMTHLTQRSCDMFLGVPFNITSYCLFTILLGIFTNTLPTEFKWVGVNAHIYSNHRDQVEAYINRSTHKLPKLDLYDILSLNDIEDIKDASMIKDKFKLVDYNSSGKIKADLSVGL